MNNYDAMIAAIRACGWEEIEAIGEAIADPIERLEYYAEIGRNSIPEHRVIAIRRRAERAFRRLARRA